MPRSPSPTATARRVVLPLIKETKSPVAKKPMASVMPASTDKLATMASPTRPRQARTRKCTGLLGFLSGAGSMAAASGELSD